MTPSGFLQSRWPSVFSALLLPGVFVLFAWAHWEAFLATSRGAMLLIAACEGIIAAMYLIRTEPVTVSGRWSDWFLAIGTTLLPMLFRPTASGFTATGDMLIGVGAALLLLSLLSLNRSLAVVPARRGIKTSGMYRLVRHPMYLSYHLMYPGYVLANFSVANALVCAATLIGLWARIFREEAHLATDAGYREYLGNVRYRVIPYLL